MKSLVRSSISFKKNIAVGVDIGYDDLKLVKVRRISDRNYEMLEYARVPFDPEFPRENPDFHRFLRPTLAEFCGANRNADIWCTISSARVETRHFRIPKVAARQIPNAIYWTYQREAAFDEDEKVFDFEILGEVEEEQSVKIEKKCLPKPDSLYPAYPSFRLLFKHCCAPAGWKPPISLSRACISGATGRGLIFFPEAI
jgi:Tfp pilus assembly PilM family ATPase